MSSSRRERDDTLPAKLGEVIGGYRLESLIGEGGMGCVYAASHHRLGRPAAVKVLRASFAAYGDYMQRFFDEARVVNAIRHPNIIDIFDFVESDNPRRVACIMELLEGDTLRKTIKENALELKEAINLGIQLADALSAVHRVNVVHRDLKPDNIFVLKNAGDFSQVPSIKVLDFGIAKMQVPTGDRTTPGLVLGTPGYMAPEQVSGQGITPAADVYAFGTLLYEIMSGQRLFVGDSMAILRQKIVGDLPPFKFPSGRIYRPLEDLIRRCVTLRPEERPDIELVGRELQSLRTGAEGLPLSRAPTVPLETQALSAAPFDDPAPALPPTTVSRHPHTPRPSMPADDTMASQHASRETMGLPTRSWWPIAVLLVSLAVLIVAGAFMWTNLNSDLVVVEAKAPVQLAPNSEPDPAAVPSSYAPEAADDAKIDPGPEPELEAQAVPQRPPEPEPEAPAQQKPSPVAKPKPSEATRPSRSASKSEPVKSAPSESTPKKPKPLRKDDMTPW